MGRSCKEGKKKVTSCCPAFVNMVRRHFPELADNISTTIFSDGSCIPPDQSKDPEAVTVFIGPCIAKKSEVVDQKIEGNADYVLTYSGDPCHHESEECGIRTDEQLSGIFCIR